MVRVGKCIAFVYVMQALSGCISISQVDAGCKTHQLQFWGLALWSVVECKAGGSEVVVEDEDASTTTTIKTD